MLRIKQRLIRLEKDWKQDPVSLRQRANRSEAALRQNITTAFFSAFPDEVLDVLSEHLLTNRDSGTGLTLLFDKVARGEWNPVRLPMSVIDILLQDPNARPDLICRRCGIVVPTRGASSRSTLRNTFFAKCPECCGSIIPMTSFNRNKYSQNLEYVQLTKKTCPFRSLQLS